jgi:hypothetical protein
VKSRSEEKQVEPPPAEVCARNKVLPNLKLSLDFNYNDNDLPMKSFYYFQIACEKKVFGLTKIILKSLEKFEA